MFDGNTKAFETKPELFSVESVAMWLQAQDPATQYCFDENGQCLLARYFRANGVRDPYVTTGGVREGGWKGPITLFPGSTGYCHPTNPLNLIAYGYPRTFGAALARARAYLLSSQSR